ASRRRRPRAPRRSSRVREARPVPRSTASARVRRAAPAASRRSPSTRPGADRRVRRARCGCPANADVRRGREGEAFRSTRCSAYPYYNTVSTVIVCRTRAIPAEKHGKSPGPADAPILHRERKLVRQEDEPMLNLLLDYGWTALAVSAFVLAIAVT